MIPAYTSPFWLDWRLIIAGLILYYLQIWIFGGCILTYAQYGKWNETFSGRLMIWIASKFGLNPKPSSIKRFLNVLPFILIIIALIYQVLLKGPVLVSLNWAK
jgi:hypothetical protein